MKILHVIPDMSPATGGPVTAVLKMSIEQYRLGHEVSIVTTNYQFSKNSANPNGVTMHCYPCHLGPWRWSYSLMRDLPNIMNGMDLVHIHMIWEFPILWAAITAKRNQIPFVLSPCGMLDQYSMSKSRWKKILYLTMFRRSILNEAVTIHFTSKNEQLNSGKICSTLKSFVCPLAVTLGDQDKKNLESQFRQRFPQVSNKQIILFLSRVQKVKRPDLVIKSFSQIMTNSNNICLVIAGPGDSAYIHRLTDIVKKLKLEEKVVFTGILSRDVVQEAYCAAHIYVHPSERENFGLTIFEAMAVGCPVVVSDKIDWAEEIKNEGAGLVCPLTENAVAEAISTLISQESLRYEIINNAKRFISNNFTWEKVIKKLMAIYGDILREKDHAPQKMG